MDWSDAKKKLLRDRKSILSHMFLNNVHKTELAMEILKEQDDWNVTIKVNGVEVLPINVDEFLNDLWKRHSELLVEEKAQELFEKKWEEEFGGIEEFLDKTREIRDSFKGVL